MKKHRWQSYEERNLVDAVTAASTKTLDVVSLRELKGTLPFGKIGDRQFSRLILGGNLLSGWAHSRDLIYVSQLVKAYHNKDRIFATLLVAEKCGVNTLLTNPILCSLIDEYWKRRIGKIQFISDCAGLEYDDKGPHPMAFDKYLDKVQRAIDYGATRLLHPGRDGRLLHPERPARAADQGRREGPRQQGPGRHRGAPARDREGLRGRGHDAGLLDEDAAPPRLLVRAAPRVARQHVLQQPGRHDRVDGRAQGALDRVQGDGGRGHPSEGSVPLRVRARGRLRVRRDVRLPDGRGREHRARRARAADAGVAAAALDGVGGVLAAGAGRAAGPARLSAMRPLGWLARRFDETRRAMSTFVAVTVEDRSAACAEEAIGRAFEEMDRVASLLTRFEAGSAVGVLNEAGRIDGPPPELRAVVGRALELHGASAGAFDPTVAPLVDLYQLHFAAHGGPPDEGERRDVIELVGAGKLRVTPRELRFDRTGMALTLDGIAKGYVVDRMIETLASHGVRHALINAGGDIRALGPRASGDAWRVGVQDPRRPEAMIEVLDLVDAAVATSGDYIRFHDVERLYHHTIVPATGRSPRDAASVSVRAATAMEADALATAVFVMGAEAGCGFVSSRPRAECLVLLRDGSRRSSVGWPA